AGKASQGDSVHAGQLGTEAGRRPDRRRWRLAQPGAGADGMSEAAALVFLLDVDNTLLDNDRFADDLGDTLAQAFGAVERDRYWSIYQQLRDSAECLRQGVAQIVGE